jgi:GMP synthase (glutamine-hydrolysing)
MNRPRIALLTAAHEPEETTRNFRRELDADLVEFHAKGGELPDRDPDAFDGVVVTGSKSSVYWDDDWIPALADYVADAHDAGVPILGVCFGHQLLAEALGGTVEDMDAFELGYREVERTTDDPILEGVPETFTTFTTHGDAVTDLPPGATLLAENDYGVHAFRAGDSVGVQFHPEYDNETAERIAREKDVDEDRCETVLADITPEAYEAACETKRLFENFTDGLVAESAAAD